MNKNYIKLNDNEFHLSIGNFIRLIKEQANSKMASNQTELFLILFPTLDFSDKSINHYCTGVRSIPDDCKKQYTFYKKKRGLDNSVLEYIIKKLTMVLDGVNKNYLDIRSELKTHPKWRKICIKLYNIAKNDSDCSVDFCNLLSSLLNEFKIYEFLNEILFFCILEKKQPILEQEEFINNIEKITSDCGISIRDIEEVIYLNLKRGMVPFGGLKSLADKGNIYACKQIAAFEFYGVVTGSPRYMESYKYYKKAADNNHPVSCWMVGMLYDKNYIGNGEEENIKKAWEYFYKASSLGCSAAKNSIGLSYLTGRNPERCKSEKIAKKYFEDAIKDQNPYAFNNLGKLIEKENPKKAFEYFLASANLGESWACNKVGECYRKGIGVTKNIALAFEYYKMATNASIYDLCYWSKFNLARYFYEKGEVELEIEPNPELAQKYYKEAYLHGIAIAKDYLK